ncbi:MAG: phoP [Elusimicrobia bacterium]|nr:MAG: phoP [Elusimicrobiota bacterium]
MKRILIIDDDRHMVDFMATALSLAAYSVETAHRSLDGLKLARSLKPEIVLLDLMMPDMHGFDVCQILRQDNSFQGKILIVSGKTFDVDKKTAKRLGADGFIEKPFTVDELLVAVENITRS